MAKTNSHCFRQNTCFRIHARDSESDTTMAPTKKSYPKKSYYGAGAKTFKNGKKKRKALTMQDAGKALGIEKKWWDTISTLNPPVGSAFVTTPSILNLFSTGGGPNSRIGAKSRMKSVRVMANALWPGGQAVNSPQQVRYVIVYDKQSNGATAGRSDVFQDGTLWNSPMNLHNQDRFITVADVIADQISSNGQFCVATDIWRKLELDVIQNQTTTTPTTGALLLWVSCNQDWNSAASGTLPTVQFYSRVRFTDM